MFRVLASLSILALAAALAQAVYGVGLWKTIPLEAADIRPDEGHAAHAKLPDAFARPLDDARGYVTENGVPTGRRAGANATVRERGRGWFKILRGHVRFSATDDTDPATNGRTYAIHLPRPVPLTLIYGLLALAVVTVTLAFRQPAPQSAKEDSDQDRYWIPKPRHPFRISPSAVFLVASLVAAYLLFVPGATYTDGGLAVKGMPYSDAEGWNEMALALSEGRGFTTEFATHRPFYSVFLGGLYKMLGPHLLIAKILNVLAAGLLAASAYLLGSRAFKSTAAGLALAAFLVLAPGHFAFLQVTATEQLGLAFTVFSVYLTWSAFSTNRPTLFLLAGVFIGLANLTRTFTLLAAILYGILLTVVAIKTRPGWLPFIRNHFLFAAGFIVVAGPWIARQSYTHDITSISSNSADLLYGAAAYGRWDARQYAEAEAAGIPNEPGQNPIRHPFFNKRLAEVVTTDTERYKTFVKARFVEYLAVSFDPRDPAFRLTAALVALAAALTLCYRRRSPAGLIALAIFLPGFIYLTGPETLTLNLPVADNASDQIPVPLIDPDKPTPAGGLLLLCAAVPLACVPFRLNRIIAVLLLVATLLGSATLSALVGNFGLARTATFGGWIYLGLALAAITGLFQLTGAILNKWNPVPTDEPDPDLAPDPEPLDESDPDYDPAYVPPPTYHLDTFAITAGFLILFVSLLGIIFMGVAYLENLGKEETPSWQLPQNDTAALRTWANSQFATEIAAGSGAPLTITPILLGDYRADIDAGEDVAHLSPIFAVRDSPRTVAKVRSGADPKSGRGGTLLAAQFPGHLPGELPRRKPFALVGLKTDHTQKNRYVPGHEAFEIEALALVPLDPDGSPDLEKAVRFPQSRPAAD